MHAAQTGNTVRSAARALGILRAFERPPHAFGITELSEQVGLSKGTVHLLVQTLVSEGYLEQDGLNRKYRLGGSLYRLFSALPSRTDLREIARRQLERLSHATSLSCYLCTMVGNTVVLLEKAEPQQPLMLVLQVGIALPLHSSALAKVLVAYAPEARRQALVSEVAAGGLIEFTPNTINRPAALRRHLAEVIARGYALDREESLPGLFCVAVPVRDAAGDVVASLGVAALTTALSEENYAAVLPVLQHHADAISAQLGYTGQ